jgi:hypothetical protein
MGTEIDSSWENARLVEEIESLRQQLAECKRERDETISNFIWQFSQYVGGDGEFTLYELRAFYDKCAAALAKVGAGGMGEIK